MSVKLLISKITEKQNPSVIGLDPLLEYIPENIISDAKSKYGSGLTAAAAAIFEFNKQIIDCTADIVPAVKLQSAFYEMYGIQGLKALEKTAAYAKKNGLYVMYDVKRNDIGSTASAYSTAYLGKTEFFGKKTSVCKADAATVNGYLGSDGIIPFVNDCNEYKKMIFVLVKTSNPSSSQLQNIKSDGKPVYMYMAENVKEWGNMTKKYKGYNAVGAVVGATFPEELKNIRKTLPNTFFLIPGYGAQGGKAEDIAFAFDKNGL